MGRGLDANGAFSDSLNRLKDVLYRAAYTGSIEPSFPEDSPHFEVNSLAEALNRAARSVVESHARLDQAYVEFVLSIGEALGARDSYTASHSARVGDYAFAIARELGRPDKEAEALRTAALLHDVGKIGIPDAVLLKSGPLTREEFALIQLHPQIGRKIVERVRRFAEMLPVIELHHENHDGSGYPYGLSKERIPLAARIVHVADAFDSMTIDRHYRPARSIAGAIEELERCSGTQFDPAITEIMVRLASKSAMPEPVTAG
jgi:putative nucleotidyltransferase with HDIG domain